MTIYTEGYKPGDLLVHIESQQYCLADGILRNKDAAAITLDNVLGFPLLVGTNGADYNLAEAGDEADVIALLVKAPAGVKTEAIGATSNSVHKYQVIKNAPAVINRDRIRAADAADADFDIDAIVTALEALGFEFRSEPSKTESKNL